MMEARSLQYTANGSIDMELNHPAYGWISFTASRDDTEALGKEMYALAASGHYGPIAPYVEPEPVPLSQAQIDALRRMAYSAEADPLFFKWQRGESTEAEWLAKIAEIRLRYPDV